MPRRILVTGAAGQVGGDLVPALRAAHGADSVVAAVHRTPLSEDLRVAGPSVVLDCTDRDAVDAVMGRYDIGCIYHLATLLSVAGERDPARAWQVNIDSLRVILDAALKHGCRKVFWPSSIAAFGTTTPRLDTPQRTVLEPTTIYGVTKVAGESLCNYYNARYGLDVRSIRYPGLVTYKSFSGGGTTDYSVEMFIAAKKQVSYTCFVRPGTILPLMYMDDAIRATIQLMQADPERLTVRTSYNLAGLAFTAGELAQEIARRVPGFACVFEPDFRQAIADSWPMTIDDSAARRDWDWQLAFDLAALCDSMLAGLEADIPDGAT